MTQILCPVCRGGTLTRGQGQLDQSGDCYLPTVVWSCARCEYTRFEPALRARWRPAAGAEAQPGEAHTARRRAA